MRKTTPKLGDKFGKLTVVAHHYANEWLCRCVCGGERISKGFNLFNGKNQSCGCLYRERGEARKIHGCVGTTTYRTWQAMRQRCLNPTNAAYEYYGGRGIKVCDRWDSFKNFLADMGERPAGTTIDRRDVNGHYEPGNCRWATNQSQQRNRRTNKLITFEGITKSLVEWCELLGVDYQRTNQRILRQGMTFVDAVTTPLDNRNAKRTTTDVR